MTKTKPRRQRRLEARLIGVPFEPHYNKNEVTGKGGQPKTYEEMFGIGYERFDDKYVIVSDKITEGGR